MAAKVGIRAHSSSLFPSKAALRAADVARRNCQNLKAALEAVFRANDAPATCLLANPGICRKALEGDSRIWIAIFLAPIDDAPDELRAEIRAFVDINLTWLAERLSTPAPDDMAIRRADAIYAAVARVQLTARFGRIAPV